MAGNVLEILQFSGIIDTILYILATNFMIDMYS